MTYAAEKKRVLAAPHYYALLGVHRETDGKGISAARNALARTFHPDRNPDPQATNLMALINRAAEVLALDALAKYYRDVQLGVTPCAFCMDTGVKVKQKGFTNRTVTACPECLGSGRRLLLKETQR